ICDIGKTIDDALNTNTRVPTTTEPITTEITTKFAFAKNCKQLLEMGYTASGVYTIKVNTARNQFKVWCDMETKNGGWLYVLNRFNGVADFFMSWNQYQSGFGNISGEFWLGLDYLYELTGSI